MENNTLAPEIQSEVRKLQFRKAVDALVMEHSEQYDLNCLEVLEVMTNVNLEMLKIQATE